MEVGKEKKKKEKRIKKNISKIVILDYLTFSFI